MNSVPFVTVLLVSLAGFVAAILWMSVAHARFVRRLRTQHPKVWNELHKAPDADPKDPGAGRRKVAGRVAYYLYSRGFRTLKDPVIQTLGEQGCLAHATFLIYTVVAAAVVLALIGFAR